MLWYGDYTRTEWDDVLVPLERTRVNPATSKPDYDTFLDGSKVHLFDKSTDESVTFSIQIPHSWRQGTTIKPHVHWCPIDTGTGTVKWGLEYTVASINGTFGATETIYVTQAGSGTAYKHQVAAFTGITMTGHTVSCMMLCRLFRDADNDTYDNDAACLQLDFHIEKESIGSYAEYAK